MPPRVQPLLVALGSAQVVFAEPPRTQGGLSLTFPISRAAATGLGAQLLVPRISYIPPAVCTAAGSGSVSFGSHLGSPEFFSGITQQPFHSRKGELPSWQSFFLSPGSCILKIAGGLSRGAFSREELESEKRRHETWPASRGQGKTRPGFQALVKLLWGRSHGFFSGPQADAPGLGKRRWRKRASGDEEPKREAPSHCLSSSAPATFIGGSTSGADIYLVERWASSLLNQDAKNNRTQLFRAPAQPAPACLPWRPFSWVLEAKCFVSIWFLVARTS